MSLYNVLNRSLMQAGQPEDISTVVSNLDAIASVLNGNIEDVNVSSAAAIQYSKISVPAGAIAPSKLTGYPADATKVLKGDGTWAIGSLIAVRMLTASGTYTPTAGTRAVYVECVGSGAGAGGCAAAGAGQGASGGGGGGGAYAASFLTSGFSGVAYTIGAAGAASAAGNSPGGNGGDTIFGASVIVAKGGLAGSGGAVFAGAYGITAQGGGGGIAASCVGDMRVAGCQGTIGYVLNTSQGYAGWGGAAGMGFGASVGGGWSNGAVIPGTVGQQYGGGGSGACNGSSGAAGAGGAGALGVIRIWEFA